MMTSRSIPIAIVFIFAIFLSALPAAAQTTWHVDDDAPGDPGPGDSAISDPLEDGTLAHPYDMIQEAIDASAVGGDTVLVAAGTYVENLGSGYRSLTLESEDGPNETVIDGIDPVNPYAGCVLRIDEGPFVIRGFTLQNGTGTGTARIGGGIYCQPLITAIITDCVIRWNWVEGLGGGIFANSSTVEISDCLIYDNWAYGYPAACGGGIYLLGCEATISDTFILWNYALEHGGGVYSFKSTTVAANNVIAENECDGTGGGYYCHHQDDTTLLNNTITGNIAWVEAGGIGTQYESLMTVRNTVLWGNSAPLGKELFVARSDYPATLDISYSDVDGGQASAHVEPGCTLNWGLGMIDADPLFVDYPLEYFLAQIATGHGADSPCLDAGGGPAQSVCYDTYSGTWCMNERSTRTDNARDEGLVDMGYHYWGIFEPTHTFNAGLTCLPAAGTVPFRTTFTALLLNEEPSRPATRVAARVDVALAAGGLYTNWRAGFTNIAAGESFETSWGQQIPALGSMIGANRFTLTAEDITPAPYNQPPYPAAGYQATDACTVTGVAP